MIFSPPFSRAGPLVVAFSGGPDSVYLGEMLLKDNFSHLIFAHFHHHLREDEGDRDALFAEKYAQERGMCFVRGDWDAPEKSEGKAREARYAFLENVRKEYSASAIVTGHHRDDCVETIFLQFLRGGGMRSMKGLEEWRSDVHIWRPLLSVPKTEILKFLKKENIAFCKDSSNDESLFARNFLRNEVFPLLESRFQGFSERIFKGSLHISSAVEFLEEEAQKFLSQYPLKEGGCDAFFPRDDFLALHPALQYEVLRAIVLPATLLSQQGEEIKEFIKNGKSGKKWEGLGMNFTLFGKNIFYSPL